MSESVICANCPKPAVFYAEFPNGPLPFCLDCWAKYQAASANAVAAQNEQMRQLAALMNYYQDEMAIVSGVPGPRIQVPHRTAVNLGGVTMHNVSVSGDNLGVINTGIVGTLDATISSIRREGMEDVAEALQMLTQAVVSDQVLVPEDREKIVECLGIIAAEAVTPEQQRKKVLMRSMITDVATWIAGSEALAQLWSQYGPVVTHLFK